MCSICLDDNNDAIVNTLCCHTFHENCLNEWKKINNTCPLCRINFKKIEIEFVNLMLLLLQRKKNSQEFM